MECFLCPFGPEGVNNFRRTSGENGRRMKERILCLWVGLPTKNKAFLSFAQNGVGRKANGTPS